MNDEASNDERNATIGDRIQTTRRERGLTQDQLAKAVGVSRSAVAQWETSRAGQITGNLQRVAETLDVTVEYLLHGAGRETPARARQGDELAMIRLYRECSPEDRQFLLRMARRLAQ